MEDSYARLGGRFRKALQKIEELKQGKGE